jgi:hypothetical protein
MNDETILEKGGSEREIEQASEQNGAAEEEVCDECNGSGIVTENAGYCGGCEVCGSTEARDVPCPKCRAGEYEGNDDERDDQD